MFNDTLSEIENRKAQVDLGVMAARVFEGAKAESASWIDAYLATAAYFHAMFKSSREDEQ